MEGITLITMLYDIDMSGTRDKKIDMYLDYGNYVLSLPYKIVIYTDNKTCNKINIDGKQNIIKIISPLEDNKYYKYRDEILKCGYNVTNKNYNKDTPEYLILTYSKIETIRRTVIENPFNTDKFIFMDYGIKNTVKNKLDSMNIQEKDISNLVSFIMINPYVENTYPKEQFKFNKGYVGAGLISGDKNNLLTFCKLFDKELENIASENWFVLEESIMAMIVRKYPKLFNLYYGDHTDYLNNYKCINNVDSHINRILDCYLNNRMYKDAQHVLSKYNKENINVISSYIERHLVADYYYYGKLSDELLDIIPKYPDIGRRVCSNNQKNISFYSNKDILYKILKTNIFKGKTQIYADKYTIVTAYYNLSKMKDATDTIRQRNRDYYFSHVETTFLLEQNIVVFCEEDDYEILFNLRPKHLLDKTKFIIHSFEDFPLTKYRDTINANKIAHPYLFDGRCVGSYYLLCMARYAMLKIVMDENPFLSTHFCWINICMERMGENNIYYLDEALNVYRDKFSTCYIDYIPESRLKDIADYFLWGRYSMCSGFFTGRKDYMTKVCNLLEQKFLYYLEKGYGHADEQLYSPVYFENPELFEFYLGDYQQMITNYIFVREDTWRPVKQVLKNCFYYGIKEGNLKILKLYKELSNIYEKTIHANISLIDNGILREFYYNKMVIDNILKENM